jgi:LAS superfamily LD-carboxypeptidase LdcB
MSYPLLHGQGHFPLTQLSPGQRLHPQAAEAFLQIQRAAASDGVNLTIYSSFRSFSTQQVIWDEKWQGLRPIIGQNNQPIDSQTLEDTDKLCAILRWSALPGASRHHWGSDLDLFDQSALPTGTQLSLLTREYEAGGHQHHVTQWLTTHAGKFGFFLPFDGTSGVACEPWHISYAPLANDFLKQLTLNALQACIARSTLQGKAVILANLEWIYQNYVMVGSTV